MSDLRDRQLADEMTFAKVVNTPIGEALLIAGNVYYVHGPEGNCAELFSRAMRNGGEAKQSRNAAIASIMGGKQSAS